MTSRDFAYWLQGYFELSGSAPMLSAAQVECIRRHLAMVFVHEIDPSFPKEQQEALDEAHAAIAMKAGVSSKPIAKPQRPIPDPHDLVVRC